MKAKPNIYKFLFAGGGTGGHLYPAVAVAQKLKELKPEAEILFIGTKNKIEADVVPQLGFAFKTLWISGFSRKLTLKNILFPLKVIVSLVQSLFINMKFKPKVAIGTGAYVSGPSIWGASVLGAKILLMEQNSYPGITNRLLEKKADSIHIAFEDSRKYFRFKSKLKLTGNPVRVDLKLTDKAAACEKLGIDPAKKTLLVLGGSLGAASLNKAVAANIGGLLKGGVQILWQTGKGYYEDYKVLSAEGIKIFPFAEDMSTVYSAADLVLARAGATTIAEASFLELALIFVPSPNVTANHQYYNAKALFDTDAAMMIEDKKLSEEMLEKINKTIFDETKLTELKSNIKNFSKPDAALHIAEDAIKMAEGSLV